MMANTLNPTSSVAQKMANNLNAEMETHRMYNSEQNASTNAQKHALHRRSQKPPQNLVCVLSFTINSKITF